MLLGCKRSSKLALLALALSSLGVYCPSGSSPNTKSYTCSWCRCSGSEGRRAAPTPQAWGVLLQEDPSQLLPPTSGLPEPPWAPRRAPQLQHKPQLPPSSCCPLSGSTHLQSTVGSEETNIHLEEGTLFHISSCSPAFSMVQFTSLCRVPVVCVTKPGVKAGSVLSLNLRNPSNFLNLIFPAAEWPQPKSQDLSAFHLYIPQPQPDHHPVLLPPLDLSRGPLLTSEGPDVRLSSLI
ncbi:hypothetical protein CB1_000513018 [Camelus ferus]|nr:hypothetical protein CB1_000513018 [Camelus ferus]